MCVITPDNDSADFCNFFPKKIRTKSIEACFGQNDNDSADDYFD